MTDATPSAWTLRKSAHLLMGAAIMGATGAFIGIFLGSELVAWIGTVFGILIGGAISMIGGRIFFMSVLSGVALGWAIFAPFGGASMAIIGAGTGGAIGGFVGITIELLRK